MICDKKDSLEGLDVCQTCAEEQHMELPKKVTTKMCIACGDMEKFTIDEKFLEMCDKCVGNYNCENCKTHPKFEGNLCRACFQEMSRKSQQTHDYPSLLSQTPDAKYGTRQIPVTPVKQQQCLCSSDINAFGDSTPLQASTPSAPPVTQDNVKTYQELLQDLKRGFPELPQKFEELKHEPISPVKFPTLPKIPQVVMDNSVPATPSKPIRPNVTVVRVPSPNSTPMKAKANLRNVRWTEPLATCYPNQPVQPIHLNFETPKKALVTCKCGSHEIFHEGMCEYCYGQYCIEKRRSKNARKNTQ